MSQENTTQSSGFIHKSVLIDLIQSNINGLKFQSNAFGNLLATIVSGQLDYKMPIPEMAAQQNISEELMNGDSN